MFWCCRSRLCFSQPGIRHIVISERRRGVGQVSDGGRSIVPTVSLYEGRGGGVVQEVVGDLPGAVEVLLESPLGIDLLHWRGLLRCVPPSEFTQIMLHLCFFCCQIVRERLSCVAKVNSVHRTNRTLQLLALIQNCIRGHSTSTPSSCNPVPGFEPQLQSCAEFKRLS